MRNAQAMAKRTNTAKVNNMESVIDTHLDKINNEIEEAATAGKASTDITFGPQCNLHKSQQDTIVNYLKLKGYKITNKSGLNAQDAFTLAISWEV